MVASEVSGSVQNSKKKIGPEIQRSSQLLHLQLSSVTANAEIAGPSAGPNEAASI